MHISDHKASGSSIHRPKLLLRVVFGHQKSKGLLPGGVVLHSGTCTVLIVVDIVPGRRDPFLQAPERRGLSAIAQCILVFARRIPLKRTNISIPITTAVLPRQLT